MNFMQFKKVILIWTLALVFVAFNVTAEVASIAFADSISVPVPLSVQQEKSIELFHEIFQTTLENNGEVNLDRITELYWQIINSCPDVPLAQESHWRLIESFFKYYQPPQTGEALLLFAQFKSRYPDSPLMNVVKYTMARGLYVNKFWHDLLELESAGVEEFFATGTLTSPLPLFYYSEAHFHLNQIEEAVRGYQALLNYSPDTRLAQMAAEKLAQMTQERK